MTGKFQEWPNCTSIWRIFMDCKVERIAYGAMGIEKAYIRWRRDTRWQTIMKLRLVSGLGSTFGNSNCHLKWHASLGSEAVLTLDNLQRGEFHYAVGVSYVGGMLRQLDSSFYTVKSLTNCDRYFSISEAFHVQCVVRLMTLFQLGGSWIWC